MNRIIKFRGLRLDGKGWAYGDLIRFTDTRNGGTLVKIYVDSLDVEEDGIYYAVDYYSIGQFTGLLDKNGKEIYEGDIVLWGTDLIGEVERPSKIEYNLEQARFEVLQYWDNQGKWYSLSNDIAYYFYRVIGNITENPELIP